MEYLRGHPYGSVYFGKCPRMVQDMPIDIPVPMVIHGLIDDQIYRQPVRSKLLCNFAPGMLAGRYLYIREYAT